ncbi:hypothetical protein [Arthrobacter sp. Soil762]|nr:hypothetical protein [Arthrobacter sp. Soil762]
MTGTITAKFRGGGAFLVYTLKRPEVASLPRDFAAVQGALSGGALMVAL